MAIATVCHDTHLERDVLVKALQDDIDQKRLSDEIAALSEIRSKHVVEIYDVVKDSKGKIVGIVEELLSGTDLNKKIPVTSLKDFLLYCYALASGLADIHEAKRVHRDIKPNNVKFDSEGCLRIFDFGLSRSEVDSSTLGTVGTIGYLAPELCAPPGEKVQFTPAVDVFAFACTAVKMIRGKIPACLRDLPPTLPCGEADFSAQTIKIPQPVAEILNRCLSKSPKKRPSMAEVRNLLSSYIVQGRHKATLVVDVNVYTLDSKNKAVSLSGSGSSVTVEYDGIGFYISSVTGVASVSNVPCEVPHRLPGSCVIILGDPQGSGGRSFIPMDISYPEVVL